MLRKLFNLLKKQNVKAKKSTRDAILSTAEYAQNLGEIAIFKGTGTVHFLYRSGISSDKATALQSERPRFVNSLGQLPTHTIFLCCKLAKDEVNYRLIFSLFFDLSDYQSLTQEWMILKFFEYLRYDIVNTEFNSRGFLISCKDSSEYPFCKIPSDVQMYWADEARQIWNRVLKDLERIQNI